MKAKGFSYAMIDKIMQDNNVDGQIKDAKSNLWSSAFEKSFVKGDTVSASAALANLLPVDPDKAKAYMSMFPQYRDFWNELNATEKAKLAHDLNREDYNYKHDVERQDKQQDIATKLAIEAAQRKQVHDALIAAGWPEEYATAKAYGGVNVNPWAKSSGGSGNSNATNGTNTNKDRDEYMKILKQYEDWNKDHPGEESKNPLREQADVAELMLNGGDQPLDPDDYTSVRHWAQMVMEKNYTENFPYTAEQLKTMIASFGGYGEQVANELEADGSLSKYGK